MKTPSTDDLIALAEHHHTHIAWHKGGPKGAWQPHHNQISLRHGMTDTETKCTLAHEIGHMLHQHPAPATPRQEAQADRYAADLLIHPPEYAAAEALHGPHPQLIAHELGVTVHLLKTWQATRLAASLERTPL